jgi:hypothetical protein
MASNCYHVQKRQWNKWTAAQRAVFNRVYAAMRMRDIVLPLQPPVIPAGAWNTVRWNAAFLAACEAYDLTFVTDKKDWNLKGTAPVKPS